MNKGKKANVKPFMVKNYLSVFINCMIENPAFDSQVCCKLNPASCEDLPSATVA
jgi:DNA gyrase/topoisomerase IV subunit B